MNNRNGSAVSSLLFISIALAGCAVEQASLPYEAGVGPAPELPAPNETWLPTVKIAPAQGWREGSEPQAGRGFAVNEFARDLDHPRWFHVLPNGDVLVAETNAPERPEQGKGIRGWFMQRIMKRATGSDESANRITLLRDADIDGVAEVRSAFLVELNSPFGMELVDDTLYVANTDAIVAFPYQQDTLEIRSASRKVADLPAGTLNHHWTKNIIANPEGTALYATVGSNSNAGENGLDREESRAAILKIDLATGATTIFASGLRNPNGLAWHPESGALWTTVNERDGLGSDLVPDYLTSVREGGFYGWPYSYFGQHIDTRVSPQRPDLVASALVPDYALGTHTGSLGLAFYSGELFPARYRGGAFVGQHGSWNRNPPAGYKVIFIRFIAGKPAGMPEDVLTGFVDAEGNAQGRPVGVAVDATGALLVADDVGGRIWRVTLAAAAAMAF